MKYTEGKFFEEFVIAASQPAIEIKTYYKLRDMVSRI
jgi:hypothetical protein